MVWPCIHVPASSWIWAGRAKFSVHQVINSVKLLPVCECKKWKVTSAGQWTSSSGFGTRTASSWSNGRGGHSGPTRGSQVQTCQRTWSMRHSQCFGPFDVKITYSYSEKKTPVHQQRNSVWSSSYRATVRLLTCKPFFMLYVVRRLCSADIFVTVDVHHSRSFRTKISPQPKLCTP
jgi:hypothetical protein